MSCRYVWLGQSLVRGVSNLPPLVGKHWEAIGFQGLDPSTDLNRSMKMLTILQVGEEEMGRRVLVCVCVCVSVCLSYKNLIA
jgi:hypothetical protein